MAMAASASTPLGGPPPRPSAAVRASPTTTSRPPTATMSTRVGTSPSSTNPVRNVPVIAPAVPIAESRPTIEPLVWRSVNVARTIIGPTADRIAAGRTNPTVASVNDRDKPLAGIGGADPPDDRYGRDGRRAAQRERRPEQALRSERVSRPAADPRPERDTGQDRTDDPGIRRERDADIRRQEPTGRD